MKEIKHSLLLESLQNDMAVIGPFLKEVSDRIISEGISEYPIFIASQEIIQLGKPVLDREEFQVNWFYTVSILEDFINKKLLNLSTQHEFLKRWDDPTQKACIFIVLPNEASFIFLPFDIN